MERMKSNYEKSIVKGLSVLSYVAFWAYCGLMIVVMGAIVFMISNGDNSAHPTVARAFEVAGDHVAITSLMIVALYAVMALRSVILFAVYQMLREFYHDHIFTALNLRYIRRCTYAFAGLVIADGILAIIWHFSKYQIGLSHGQSIVTEILAWLVVYTIYVIFQRGVKLKQENEDFV